MCDGNCQCGSQANDSEAYEDGFENGFYQARVHFWAEFMIKAGDMKMLYQQLRKSSGDNSIEADAFALIEATYMNAADAILRGSRQFPGYFENGDLPWDNSKDAHRDDESDHGSHSEHCDCGK